MNFLHLNYLPGLLLCFLVLLGVVILLERRFFAIVRKHWFYRRSIFSYISSILILLGLGGLLLSLLDARGPEEKIKTKMPTDRTIILLDTSASMLAEDVKPSRLQKSALIAKHFARRAAGHQLSIVGFAEIQKKIVPFTNDLDLIDARLESLKNLRNHYGSSALSVAIQESIQYFKEIDGSARGNILVLTDGEETAAGIDLKIPEEIHIAFVGVGTKQGGRIPLDDNRGFRFGYKKHRGQDVITTMNESFFQSLVADIPSAKYWLANSYSLPSDEIMEFFQGEKVKGEGQQDMTIRPVLMEWIVVPSLVLLLLGYLFKAVRVFSLGLLLIILPVRADEQKPLSPEVISKLDQLKAGKLESLEKLKLADDLYKGEAKAEALELYKENLDMEKIDPSVPPEAYLNYGTGLLEKGQVEEALDVYERLYEALPKDSAKAKSMKDIMEKNAVTVFKKKEEQKKQDQQKKDEEKKEDKDKKEGDGGEGKEGKEGKDGKDSKENKDGQKNPQQQPKDGKSGNDNKQPQKDENQGEQKNKDKAEDTQGDEEKKSEDGKAGESASGGEPEKKPKASKKLTAKLKQLMSDDRQLQMKMIENGTRDLNKTKSRSSKDW